MKRIYIQFLLLLTVVFSISLQAQTLPTVNNDEFLMNSGGTYSDLQPDLAGGCSGCEVPDLNFNWSNSFDAAVMNETYIRRAAKKKAREWYNRQVNEIAKPAIDKKFGRTFSSFTEAKNELLIDSERRNIATFSEPIRDRYRGLKSEGFYIQKKHLKELKLLKLREAEIKSGNINNPAFDYIKVQGVYLKDIKSLNSLKSKWTPLLSDFSKNTAETHINNDMYKSIGKGVESEVIKLKNQHYNSLNPWDKLSLLQFLVHYEEYKKRSSPPHHIPEHINNMFKKFNNIDKATPELIESLSIKNRTGGFSVFDNRTYNKLLNAYMAPPALPGGEYMAKMEWERLKKEALDKLIRETSIEASVKVDFFILMFNITDKYQIKYLNDNYQNKKFLELHNLVKLLIDDALENPDKVYKDLKIKDILEKGAIIAKLIDELKITDSNQKEWLYEHKTEANNFIGFANNNRVSDKITDKAQAYIKGQVELEAETQNIPWKPSTGIIENNPHLKFTHVYHNHGKNISYYKLTDGSVIASSSYEKVLTSAGDLIDKDRSNIGGCQNCRFYYIKLSENDAWAEMLFNPKNHSDELKTLFALAGKEIGVNLGRYVLPVEDIKILIDGKDFDGQQVARWKGATFLLLTVVPGSKGLKIAGRIAVNAARWGKIIVVNGKRIKYSHKLVNGIVDFGTYQSKKFRKVLGIADDLTKQAHHVLSRNLRTHRAIQKAAKSKTNPFHIDEFLNGIPVDKWRNQPNHHLYDRRIRELLDAIPSGLSPEDTFSRLELIIKNVKKVIKNNPDTHLNDLIF